MGMPAVAGDWTAEKVRALPQDGNRYEVVDGELLVTPAPAYRHQAVAFELLLRLNEYLRPTGNAAVLFSPADIEFDARTLVQPDLFVYPLRKGEKPRICIHDPVLGHAMPLIPPSFHVPVESRGAGRENLNREQ